MTRAFPSQQFKDHLRGQATTKSISHYDHFNFCISSELRFGDTAANSLVYSLCESLDPTGALLPVYLKTGLGRLG